jgi:hypothetical protein
MIQALVQGTHLDIDSWRELKYVQYRLAQIMAEEDRRHRGVSEYASGR